MAEEFSIGQIVSLGAGVLVCDLGDLYRIANYMAGESVFTHQLPRVGREARPGLIRQYASLEATFEEAKQVTGDNWREWVSRWAVRHGETLTIEPMDAASHRSVDPFSEAEAMAPNATVKAVVI